MGDQEGEEGQAGEEAGEEVEEAEGAAEHGPQRRPRPTRQDRQAAVVQRAGGSVGFDFGYDRPTAGGQARGGQQEKGGQEEGVVGKPGFKQSRTGRQRRSPLQIL